MPSVDWERIRAEYIAGGISYKKLSDKYRVSLDAIKRRASKEEWNKERANTAPRIHQETVRKTVQRVSNECANNAAIAQRIRTKLLLRLEREIDSMPEQPGTDTHQSTSQRIRGENGNYTIKDMYRAYKFRDLTAAYRDLTSDMDLKGDPDDDKLLAYLEGMKHA